MSLVFGLLEVVTEFQQTLAQNITRSRFNHNFKKFPFAFEKFKLQSEITRLAHPALDSQTLAQFFTFITTRYNFNRIFDKIRQTIIYDHVRNLRREENYNQKINLNSTDQVLGIEIALHGRIPREPVRPRKTVQVKMLGSRSVRQINKNMVILNKAQGINPELGTFTF